MIRARLAVVLALVVGELVLADGNRLTYLDSDDPYYVGRDFPRLITPQWVGEEGVDGVIVVAVDDMHDWQRYEQFLRPILERLKKIDGRAPVSIMTNRIPPEAEHLQQWLKEGLSFEVHTLTHPCPLLAQGNFEKARKDYEGCVDLMNQVPGNRPVAFRMPCCDSLNTPSPRFFAEMFNKTTAKGNYLAIDSSVFNVSTANDPEVSRAIAFDSQGRERFRKYLPFPSFVNTIEDYPYPYLIGKLCWEFSCGTPSDWEAQNIQKPKNPQTVEDWKRLIDVTVAKKGVFTMVFHPHGWIENTQVVEMIDYADRTYGKRVKFLNFKEALERINRNLLDGQAVRRSDGGDNGVRLMDVDGDGYLDVVIGNEGMKETRVFDPKTGGWNKSEFPAVIGEGTRFGMVDVHGRGARATILAQGGAWYWDGKWAEDRSLMAGLPQDFDSRKARLRDLDHDGSCEIVSEEGIYRWGGAGWEKLPFGLPEGVKLLDEKGRDAGLRFIDIDEDGFEDVVFSNDERYSLDLWSGMKGGWGKRVLAARHGDPATRPSNIPSIPPIVSNGQSNGAWFHSRHIWFQNENTDRKPDLVDRRSYAELLAGVEPGPRSVDAALKSFKLAPGFKVEAVASEPLVEDPIAFSFAPDGKLWVVEMGDYPLGVDGKGTPGGKVRILEDADGDGKFDKMTVFLDGLPFPTGITTWGRGVIITAAPDILYAEDTDGDGKADVKQVLYTGFTPGNQQHRLNGLAFGLDGWLYCANGHSGGRVKAVCKAILGRDATVKLERIENGQVTDIRGRDFKINPQTGGFELETGISQYGRSRDDWGDWFGCDNSNPCFQFILDEKYLGRNPYFAAGSEARLNVSRTPGAAPVYPVSRTVARFNDFWAANHFTSANSIIVYRDELFGKAFEGNTFVSEPVHNLVHREIMHREGERFVSERAASEQTSEFLASTDNWFRPTMLQIGPDGALWIADMYRYVIEHPEWIPKDWQKRLDLRAGHDMGRIYRVYPVGSRLGALPNLARMSTAELVRELESGNGWRRDMAQRLLVMRADASAGELLKKMFASSSRATARLGAIYTLAGLGKLEDVILEKALSDAEAGVRWNAVKLCEGQMDRLGKAVLARVEDADAQVRLQTALTLGTWDDPAAAEGLAKLMRRSGDDRILFAAVMTSINPRNVEKVVESVVGDKNAASASGLGDLVRSAAGMRSGQAIDLALERLLGDPASATQFLAISQVLDAMEQGGWSTSRLNSSIQRKLQELRATAGRIALDEKQPLELRIAAVALAARKNAADLEPLLSPRAAAPLRAAAISALGRRGSAADLLLKHWNTYTPDARNLVIDALLARAEGTSALLAALEARKVLPTDLDAVRRQALSRNRSAEIRRRAETIFEQMTNPDREKVIEAYRSALSLAPDARHGAAIFEKTCSACHQIAGVGRAVGPDLASLGDRASETLLVSILDPNRAVEPRFTGYLVETRGGETLTGILANESATGITLALANSEPRIILRQDIRTLRSTGLSLMPEGLEQGYTAQDLADLIAFVRAAQPVQKPKAFPGNSPKAVMVGLEGTYHLTPADCSIYGTSLVLEKQYGNLGYWQSEDDRAVWELSGVKGGRYDVWLDYACPADSAGNALTIDGGAGVFTSRISSSGNWDVYQRIKVGQITLPGGKVAVIVRSGGPIKGALLDLKSLDLLPAAK